MAADLLVTATQGEALDALLWRTLGVTNPMEAVLAANPGLSAAVRLAEGQAVIVPIEALQRKTASLVQLWN
jgi:phage tail protein X